MAPTTFRNYDPRLQAYLPFDQSDYYAPTPTSTGSVIEKRHCLYTNTNANTNTHIHCTHCDPT